MYSIQCFANESVFSHLSLDLQMSPSPLSSIRKDDTHYRGEKGWVRLGLQIFVGTLLGIPLG